MQDHKYVLTPPWLTLLMLGLLAYIILHAIWTGFSYVPTEADSLYYHIPLAESFLNGEFGFSGYQDTHLASSATSVTEKVHMYFPAASEVLLAVLLALHLPVGFFNVFGLLALFAGCYALGRSFELDRDEARTFAATVGSLYGVVRWVHAQTVDIWLAAYYVWILALLQKPKHTLGYFLNLGILLGFLIGSKYSGPLFAVGLLLVYGRSLATFFGDHPKLTAPTMARGRAFHNSWMGLKVGLGVVFAAVIGGFWYLRNWLVKSNPFFPLDTPLFAGTPNNEIIATPIWKAYLLYPREMIDGAISEFMIWSVAALGMVLYLGYWWWRERAAVRLLLGQVSGSYLTKLLLLAAINFAVFLLLPSGDSMQLHVSQYRFAYVVIIPCILAFCILAKKIPLFAYFLPFAMLANLAGISAFPYRPKIALLLIFVVAFYLYLTKTTVEKKY